MRDRRTTGGYPAGDKLISELKPPPVGPGPGGKRFFNERARPSMEILPPSALGLLDEVEDLLRSIDHHIGDSHLHRAYLSSTAVLENVEKEVGAALRRCRELRTVLGGAR